jgi:ABC-type multidrug transport system fused ATPase/permease subunit
VTCLSAVGVPPPRSYQGSIIDKVIQDDRSGFQEEIILYVSLSVAVGLFGGIRTLCFNLIGQSILTQLRDQLFGAIIHQDISFFDATTTGELTSRISNDASCVGAQRQRWHAFPVTRSAAV